MVGPLVTLLGHLLSTGIVFLAFFGIAWSASFVLAWLHGIHPFPDSIYRIVSWFEIGIVYIDAAVCLFMLASGAWHFCSEIWRTHHARRNY
jgi:hypothetical protein